MHNQSIEILVKKAMQNDECAFEELFVRFYPSVYNAAMKLCKHDADAQDIAQLTFLQVRKSIHDLENPDYFPLWINRICVNKCKNLFRSNRITAFSDEYYEFAKQSVVTNREELSNEEMHFITDQEVLMKLIQTLSEDHQNVLQMSYFNQMSHSEIAKVLNIPTGTVKSRLHKAKSLLKMKIETYEEVEGVSLNFQMDAIGAIFSIALFTKQMSLSNQFKYPFYRTFLMTCSTNLMKYARNLSIIGGLGMSVIIMLKVTETISNVEEHPIEEIKQNQNMNVFTKVYMDEYEVVDEQSAYFLLRGYAFDAKSIETLEKETIDSMVPAYEELKKTKSVFFDLLHESGWAQAFESIQKAH